MSDEEGGNSPTFRYGDAQFYTMLQPIGDISAKDYEEICEQVVLLRMFIAKEHGKAGAKEALGRLQDKLDEINQFVRVALRDANLAEQQGELFLADAIVTIEEETSPVFEYGDPQFYITLRAAKVDITAGDYEAVFKELLRLKFSLFHNLGKGAREALTRLTTKIQDLDQVFLCLLEDGFQPDEESEEEFFAWLSSAIRLVLTKRKRTQEIQDGDQDRSPDEMRRDKDKNQNKDKEGVDGSQDGSPEEIQDGSQDRSPDEIRRNQDGDQDRSPAGIHDGSQNRSPDEIKRDQDGPQDRVQEGDPGARGNLAEREQIQEIQDGDQERSPDEMRRDKNQDGPQDKIQEEDP